MATYKRYQTLKRILTFLIFLTLAFPVFSKEYKVHGPQGGLAMELTLPDDFNEDTDKCPMVILMHGSKDTIVPMSCSERFVETYTQEAELVVVEGENHMIKHKSRFTCNGHDCICIYISYLSS